MELKRLLSLTRQALDDYQMIENGDRICIGISGGKDSLALLYALHSLQKFYPQKFQLEAVTVDLGFPNFDLTSVKKLCDQFLIPYTIISTQISQILFESRKEIHPCSLCSKMRKGALNRMALDLECNKVAYAHHKNDLIDTMLLSMLYEGRFYSFSPVTHLDQTNLQVIRPMIYIWEKDIIGFKNKYNLPVCKNPCPVDHNTRREYVNKLTKTLENENPGVQERLFHAIINGKIDGWPQKQNKR